MFVIFAVYFRNEGDRHYITDILLKVVFNIPNLTTKERVINRRILIFLSVGLSFPVDSEINPLIIKKSFISHFERLVQSNLPIPSKYQYFFDWCVDNNYMSIILMHKKNIYCIIAAIQRIYLM
jgi:hypothetical protein